MEAMNVKIYRQLQLSHDQKQHLQEFWDAWEYRKRSIDKTMRTARAKLRNLPYGVALPLSFINRVNVLAGSAMHAMRGCTPGVWDAVPASAVMSVHLDEEELDFDKVSCRGTGCMHGWPVACASVGVRVAVCVSAPHMHDEVAGRHKACVHARQAQVGLSL